MKKLRLVLISNKFNFFNLVKIVLCIIVFLSFSKRQQCEARIKLVLVFFEELVICSDSGEDPS